MNGGQKTVRVVCGTLGLLGVLLSTFYVLGMAPRLNWVIGIKQFLYLGASLFLPICFLLFRASEGPRDRKVPWYDFLAAAICFAIPLYLYFTYQEAEIKSWSIFPPITVVVLGVIMCVLLLEAGRRTAGKFFAICCLVMLIVPMVGSYLPGMLQTSKFSLDRLIGTVFVSGSGMFGSIMQVFVLVYLLFIFFGLATQIAGAGKFFTNIAFAFLGRARGGTAKAAVISSSLFGTISGSATANVMVSGSFTIPMMKNAGYKPHIAAAIESAASEGGIIMPPVMGAVAFIMANFLGIPYWKVALAAAVPAVLYYWCLFSQVHIHAINNFPAKTERTDVPPLGKTLLEGWHLIITAAVLVWSLFISKMPTGQSALLTTVVLLVLCTINPATRPNWASLVKMVEDSSRIFGQVAAILLGVGLITGGFALSGLHVAAAQWLQSSSPNVWIALLILAVVCVALGTGLPGGAVYVIVAVLLAPGLVKMGLNQMAVHMTILYWGLIADFTPPTAITPVVAAGFAGASPMKTTWQSMRFAAVIYIAPFFFIFHPVILLQNFQILPFAYAVLSAFPGFYLVAQGFEGFGSPETRFKIVKRVVILVAAVLVLTMTWYLQIVGVVLAGGVLLSKSSPVWSSLPAWGKRVK
ncbi:MAG: TRAP transporter fused permease subunit [Dehalococcoidia bacterium]|nr:TRAP transporter fused permease subunit [Dehalococcoidia bacterium]